MLILGADTERVTRLQDHEGFSTKRVSVRRVLASSREWQVQPVPIGSPLAFNDVAASQAPSLYMDSCDVDALDTPEAAFGILEHHNGIDVANIVGKGIEIMIDATLHRSFSRLYFFVFRILSRDDRL